MRSNHPLPAPHVLAMIGFLVVLSGLPAPALWAQSRVVPELVVLVRHAEQAGSSADDPGLTELGSRRARDLARLLADAGITRIHSSDTRRTLETAGPLAERLGIDVEHYDPRALGAFAERLRQTPGRSLVVGHSNTTDELAVLLGGASSGPIEEAWEYDRLYILTPAPGGGMQATLIRYGPAIDPPGD